MMALFRFGGKSLHRVQCYLGWALVAFCLVGCAGWQARDQGFRESDLDKTAQAARSQKADQKAEKDKHIDYWSFSEKGRQIERDLAP